MTLTQDKIIAVITSILILSGLFAFLGVYDTNTMPLLQRIFFWGATFSTGTVVGLLVIPWVFNGPLRDQHIAFQLIALSAIASMPVVIVLAAYNDGLTGAWPLLNWGQQYLLSFVISILVNTGAFITIKAAGWIPQATPRACETQLPVQQFLERLPVKYHDAELYAVSSEDHYLRVHTNYGEELILMRFADALRELSAVDGLQIHRSWWVARSGVVNSISKNGKYSLVLKTETAAPVSRSFSKAAREANYFNK